jgi:hypothetical protein
MTGGEYVQQPRDVHNSCVQRVAEVSARAEI